ncbi:hypothetical protein JB92DRAFT_2905787, partial [Gautieria morchelliformis]
MRAVDHCVEALCTYPATRTVEESAEQGLRHLVPGLLTFSVNRADVAVRGSCQVGAWKAIETQLGGVADVPHRATSCAMFPAVM